MIVIGIGIGVVVGVLLMGIMCKGTIEDYERQFQEAKEHHSTMHHSAEHRLGGKVKR